MKKSKNLERMFFAILMAILLILSVICYCKSQYGHEWHVIYSDELIVVERCFKCGEERFYNPY